MSNNEPITAAPESLAFDVRPMAAAVKVIRSSKEPIVKYITQVGGIRLGEQPVKVDGVEALRYDVLAKKPELRTKLYEAIHHANGVEGHLLALHNWSAGSATQVVGNIVPRLQAILTMVDNSTGAVSQADFRTIREHMQMIAIHTQLTNMAMRTISAGVDRFISGLIVDHDTFASGPYELQKVYMEVGSQISEDAAQYVLKPISRGIGEAMLQIGRAFLASIEHLGEKLANALTVHEAMGTAASALATACSNAFVKYEAGANAVARADAEKMKPIALSLQLDAAIASWNDFAKFFSESDL